MKTKPKTPKSKKLPPHKPFIDLVSKAVAKDQANGPINVAVPNVSREKMKAICDLAESIKLLAKTLDSVNVNVEVRGNVIANNTFAGTDAGAIRVGWEWKDIDGYFKSPIISEL